MGIQQKKELQLFLEGDRIFFKKLYAATYDFCRKRLHGVCPEDIQDITQETILAAYKAVQKPNFELKVLVTTFVFSIAKRKLIDYIRKKTGQSTILSLTSLNGDNKQGDFEITSLEKTTQEVLEEQEMTKTLKTLLKSLPAKEYEIILRNLIHGEKIEDIAKDQGEQPNTIAVKKRRILKKLKELAKKYINSY